MTKLIFEGNFIAKLLRCYRKCKKIAKIFACGELNLLDFEQVNVVAPKGFGKTEMDLIRIQRFIALSSTGRVIKIGSVYKI